MDCARRSTLEDAAMITSQTTCSPSRLNTSHQQLAPSALGMECGVDCREAVATVKSDVTSPTLQLAGPSAQQWVEPRVGFAGKAAVATTGTAIVLGILGLGLIATGLAVGLHRGKDRHHSARHKWVGGWVGGMAGPGVLLVLASLGVCAAAAGKGRDEKHVSGANQTTLV